MDRRNVKRLRSVAGWVCAVLAAVCIPVAVTAHWAHRTLVNNDRYVATLAPLAQDRQFTDRLAAEITTALYRQLPGELQGLSLAHSARSAVQSAVAHQLAQPSFQAIWNRANSHAQNGAVRILNNTDAHGRVVVDLSPVITTLLDHVDSPIVRPLVPTLDRVVAQHPVEITLLTSAQLVEARNTFADVVDAQWLLGGLAIGLTVVALAVAPRRWRVLFAGAVCTVVTTTAAFVALAVARSVSVSRAAADGADALLSGRVFDVLDRYLRLDLAITLFVAAGVAVVVAIGAFARRLKGQPWRGGNGGQIGRSATAASSATASSSDSGA